MSRSWPRVGLAFVALCASCGSNPQIGGVDRYVATTPGTFSEARVFFLADPEPSIQVPGSSAGSTVEFSPDLRRLTSAFQANKSLERSFAESPAATPVARLERQSRYVLHNQPISVIVNKVVTPSFAGTRDLAVVLDIITKGDQRIEPLVVWYQRDVPGGKELGFENLLVYYDPAWDSKVPPYFRIRLIDVEKEDNAAIRELLGAVEKLAASFIATVPHPAMAGVELGIQAAKEVLGSKNNTLLMDYTVQFYSASDRDKAGGADLGYLATGHWIALGMNRNQDAERWRYPLFFDQRTLRVYGEEDVAALAETETSRAKPDDWPTGPVATGVEGRPTWRPRLDSPIVLMTVTTAESVVPTVVMDRSLELTQYLSESPAKMNLDGLTSTMSSLESAVKTFAAKRRVEREQTGDAMEALVELLTKHQAAIAPDATEDAREHRLSNSDVSLLVLTLERETGLTDKSSVDAWLTWWRSGGNAWSFVFNEKLKRKIWQPTTGNG